MSLRDKDQWANPRFPTLLENSFSGHTRLVQTPPRILKILVQTSAAGKTLVSSKLVSWDFLLDELNRKGEKIIAALREERRDPARRMMDGLKILLDGGARGTHPANP